MLLKLRLLLLLFFSFSVCAAQSCTGTIPKARPYAEPGHYAAIEYNIFFPTSWTLDTCGLLQTQFIATSPAEFEGDTIRESVSLIVKDSKNLHNFVVSSENWIRTNGSLVDSHRHISNSRQEYHAVVFTLQEQPKLVYQQYYFFKYGFIYELTFVYESTSFFDYNNTGEWVLNSFNFMIPW
jgi:hypothetical protein